MGGRCGLYGKRPPVSINRELTTRRAPSRFGTHARVRTQYIISLWPPPDLAPLLVTHSFEVGSWCSWGPAGPHGGSTIKSINVRTVPSVVEQKGRIERLAVVLVFHRPIVHRCTALDLLHPTKGTHQTRKI